MKKRTKFKATIYWWINSKLTRIKQITNIQPQPTKKHTVTYTHLPTRKHTYIQYQMTTHATIIYTFTHTHTQTHPWKIVKLISEDHSNINLKWRNLANPYTPQNLDLNEEKKKTIQQQKNRIVLISKVEKYPVITCALVEE